MDMPAAPARSRSIAAMPGRGVVAQIDDGDVRRGAVRAAASVDDADGNPAGAQHLRRLPFELLIVTDD